MENEKYESPRLGASPVVPAQQSRAVHMATLRPDRPARLIFSAISLIICLPGIHALWLGQWSGLTFVLFGVLLGIGPMLRYAISWDTDSLTYQGLISTRKIQFSDVKKFSVHGPAFNDKLGPTVSLSISFVLSSTPVMTINIKPFSRRDIARLTERLKQVTG